MRKTTLLSFILCWAMAELGGPLLGQQGAVAQVVTEGNLQTLAQETSKARETFERSWDEWKRSSPGLESRLTTFQDLEDLKKQVQSARKTRQQVDVNKSGFYQTSRKQLLAVGGIMEKFRAQTADPAESLKALDMQYRNVKLRRDAIADEIAEAEKRKDILLASALRQEVAVLEKLSIRLRDQQDSMTQLKENVAQEQADIRKENASWNALLQFYDQASRASAEVGAAYDSYYEKMERLVDDRKAKQVPGAGTAATKGTPGASTASATPPGRGPTGRAAGTPNPKSSPAATDVPAPRPAGNTPKPAGKADVPAKGGPSQPPPAERPLSVVAKLVVASLSLRFEPQPAGPVSEAKIVLANKVQDKLTGTLDLTYRLETNTFPAVLEVTAALAPDGLIRGTWKERGGKGKGEIVFKHSNSLEVQIIEPKGQTKVKPAILVFFPPAE